MAYNIFCIISYHRPNKNTDLVQCALRYICFHDYMLRLVPTLTLILYDYKVELTGVGNQGCLTCL